MDSITTAACNQLHGRGGIHGELSPKGVPRSMYIVQCRVHGLEFFRYIGRNTTDYLDHRNSAHKKMKTDCIVETAGDAEDSDENLEKSLLRLSNNNTVLLSRREQA